MDKLVHWQGRSLVYNIPYKLSVSTEQALEYAPWGNARPYDGGFRYNCMMLKVKASSQVP